MLSNLQRIVLLFPTIHSGGSNWFHHFWLLQYNTGWCYLWDMTNPKGWAIQKSRFRCYTVECREYKGLLVLKLFMTRVKSDAWSDPASLSSIESDTKCWRAAKSTIILSPVSRLLINNNKSCLFLGNTHIKNREKRVLKEEVTDKLASEKIPHIFISQIPQTKH